MNKNKVFFGKKNNSDSKKPRRKQGGSLFSFDFLSNLNLFGKDNRNNKNNNKSSNKSYNPNSNFVYRSSSVGKNDSKTKIFKPKPNKSKIVTEETEAKSNSYPGFLSSIFKVNKTTFTQYINFFIFKFKITEKFNLIVSLGVISVVSIFLLYLMFFDTKFLVKDYEVVFDNSCVEGGISYSSPENCSYLDKEETAKVLSLIKENNFLYVVPNNNFWFLNGKNLTESVKSRNNEVTNIEVIERQWPNKAKVEVTTKPILITLGINNNEYWRIGQSGDVVSKDDIGLRERLVVVESRVDFNKPGADLGDFSFERSREQLNRFWFIIWLWQKLEENDIQWVKTSIPTLFDSDVIITTSSNTRIYFDYAAMSRENQTGRIEWIFNEQSSVKQAEARGVYKYLDFRQKNRVFLCRYGQECAG